MAHLYGLAAADLSQVLYAPYAFPLVAKAIKDGVMAEFKRLCALGLPAYAEASTAGRPAPEGAWQGTGA